ncbi:MAG: cobalamin-dependent protein, partial [Actinomycetota bacterium]|nr:cobalamin-dependent protein [Actinomycetota bacterium]
VDPERKSGLKEYLDDAMLAFSQPVELSVTFLDEGSQYGPIAGHVLDLLLLGHKEQASKYILETVNAGTSIRDCYLKIIQPLQYEIGRLWHAGKISVGQEHYVTAASQMIMSQFYPAIMDHPSSGKRIVTACISGEQHELGLRMVSDLLELEGWDTMFLGANTPLSTIPETVLEWKAGLLAISVTLSTHLDKLEQLIQLCRIQTPATKIMVGGYPFNLDKHLWHKMGADGYADDAVSTIGVAGKLLAGA